MSKSKIRDRIEKAIETTKKVVPGYFEKTCAQRAGRSDQAAGSTYEGVDSGQLEQMLLTVEWEPYSHEAVMDGCEAFKAKLPGPMGVVDLAKLPDNMKLALDDRKGTGKVSVVIDSWAETGRSGEKHCTRHDGMWHLRYGCDSHEHIFNLTKKADFTVLILGQEKGEEVVFTFHPGEPVRPSRVDARPGLHGQRVTVREAINMGLETAKIVGKLPTVAPEEEIFQTVFEAVKEEFADDEGVCEFCERTSGGAKQFLYNVGNPMGSTACLTCMLDVGGGARYDRMVKLAKERAEWLCNMPASASGCPHGKPGGIPPCLGYTCPED